MQRSQRINQNHDFFQLLECKAQPDSKIPLGVLLPVTWSLVRKILQIKFGWHFWEQCMRQDSAYVWFLHRDEKKHFLLKMCLLWKTTSWGEAVRSLWSVIHEHRNNTCLLEQWLLRKAHPSARNRAKTPKIIYINQWTNDTYGDNC